MCAITFVLDWIKWDITEHFLMKGLFNLLATLFIALIFIGLSVIGIRFYLKNHSISKQIALVPILLLLFSALLYIVFPFTKTYMTLAYLINKENMEQVVEMIDSNEMQYFQVGENRYSLPSNMRQLSHVGQIFTQIEDSTCKILFYVHCGIWKSSAIIYASEGSEIVDGDFGRVYESTDELSENWFCVTMRWLDE